MNSNLESRVFLVERLLDDERAKRKSIKSLSFENSFSDSGIYLFPFLAEVNAEVSFELSFIGVSSSLVSVSLDDIDISTYKSIIGDNRLFFSGVATKREAVLKVTFIVPSSVSSFTLVVSGAVEKNDFSSFICGDSFSSVDYLFSFDGYKNISTLYLCQKDELTKKNEFTSVNGGCIKLIDENLLLISLIVDGLVKFIKFDASSSQVLSEVATDIKADFVSFSSKLYVLYKGKVKAYSVFEDLSFSLDTSFPKIEATGISAIPVFSRFAYKAFDGIWYLYSPKSKLLSLCKSKTLHLSSSSFYCCQNGIAYEQSFSNRAKATKAYCDELLPLSSGYVVRRGQNLIYKNY